MNILITGGTGFIGRHLTRALTRQGFRCTCLVRPGRNLDEIEELSNVRIVYGDVTRPDSLQKCVQDMEGGAE